MTDPHSRADTSKSRSKDLTITALRTDTTMDHPVVEVTNAECTMEVPESVPNTRMRNHTTSQEAAEVAQLEVAEEAIMK